MFNYLKWPKNDKQYIMNESKFIYKVQYTIITGLASPLTKETCITSNEEVKSIEQMQEIIEDMIAANEMDNDYPLYRLGEFEVLSAFINDNKEESE